MPTAVSFTTGTENSSGTVITATYPADIANGDLLYLYVFRKTDAFPGNVTTPSGWTLVQTDGTNFATRQALYRRTADGTETGSFDVTVEDSLAAGNPGRARIVRITGGTHGASTISRGQADSSGVFALTGLTPSENNALVLSFFGATSGAGTPGTLTLPAGFSALGDAAGGGFGTNTRAAQLTQTTAVSTGSVSWTNSEVSRASGGFVVSVLPAAAPPAPTIDTQPTSQTVTAPASATFTVAATGEGTLSYQWQVNDGGGWENISGATSTSYNTGSTTTALDGYQYRVNVTDDNDTVTSNAVTLTVEAAPGPQLTAPTFINLGQTTVTPRVTTDTDNGDIYYVIFLRSQSDPTATQIRNGQNSAGVAAIRSGNTPVTEAGVVTFPEVTGLDDDTEYRMGFVHEGIGPGE